MTKSARAKSDAVPARRGRKAGAARSFPASSFEDALEFAEHVYRLGSGQRVRRLTLFDQLGKAPESSSSRMLITNSNRYGLTSGGYQSDYLELTADGLIAVGEGVPAREKARVRVKLAITNIEPFKILYERFEGTKLPAKAVLLDTISEAGVAKDFTDEGVDTFIVNLRFVDLLKTLSGAERIVSISHMLDTLPQSAEAQLSNAGDGTPGRALVTQGHATFETTCFYITPIGDPGTEQRKHSDLFLGSIVEPAMASFKLKVIRADAIEQPGMITRQIIEYLLRSRLVIADLSYHNPNVFYELALRHAVRLPVVQIIRIGERIPFDLHQMRTILIDNADIYSLVPKIATYQAEIASHVRRALEPDVETDTPISVYFPGLSVEVPSLLGPPHAAQQA